MDFLGPFKKLLLMFCSWFKDFETSVCKIGSISNAAGKGEPF